MKMDLPKKHQRWEKQRSEGPFKFIFLRWTLGWGIFMSIGMSLFDYFDGESITLDHIAALLFCYSLTGAIFGAITWLRSEDSYQKCLSQTPKDN